jgi:hypothetical protein
MANKTSENNLRLVKGSRVLRDRQKDDFYPTPKECTRLLLENEPPMVGTIWECACGDGRMVEVFLEYGHSVIASDLRHTGFGQGGVDFLLGDAGYKPTHIITNPPFKLASEFLIKALDIIPDDGRVALFLPLSYLAGTGRMAIFNSTPLARVYVLSRRATLLKDGAEKTSGGMTDYAWFVWDKTISRETLPTIQFCDQAAHLRAGEVLDGVAITKKKPQATTEPLKSFFD